MPSPPVISAVIPVHNEAGFIDEALPQVVAAVESVGMPFEIIIAENGSSDATASIARGFAETDQRIRVVSLIEADYGAAMRRGFADARGQWIVNFDIDYFSGDFLVAALHRSSEADVVLASKRAAGAEDRRSLMRRIGTWGFNVALKLLFRSNVTDTHGMKMVRREVVDRLLPEIRSTQDLFDTELVIRAERAGYRIAEVPAIVEEMREARSSFIGRVPRTLRGLWRIRRDLRSESKA